MLLTYLNYKYISHIEMLKNKIFLRSSKLPQVFVDRIPPDVWHFQNLLFGFFGDLCAPVQVYGPQQLTRIRQMLKALVGDRVALADIEHLEVAKRFRYVQYAIVRYLART